ncbi:DNA-processing protein DprA [Maritalea mediterranea]|uniref:DNA-processing protein DprA n=1 Tax=Maritalea mediterranea TaxID=2909667 RepID=A0ABS9EEQ1_9HYPH|nr:DNA-processing protein DprA [Maritalea mediterranea]MCF4099888.1 DNA-processing protein DprA [Maritalea mediterranea]
MDGTATSATNDQQLFDWLRLIRSDNVGPAMFKRLINRFGSASNALDALPDLIKNSSAKRAIRLAPKDKIEAEIEQTDRFGARFITLIDPPYPDYLKQIADAPPLLTMLGNPALFAQPTIGIVGARNSSAAGTAITRQLAQQLGEAGYVIASGLAKGIDAAAHQAALPTGTIAVFAGGIDHIYPDSNIELARNILRHKGVLMTERAFGSVPRAQDFPRRNRIVSGLSLGIVVIEAALRSGSLITARMALEQNRDVMAVPGFPLDPRGEGGNKLIRDGATLVRHADDILAELQQSKPLQQQNLLQEDDFDQNFVPDACPPDATETVLAALSPTPTPIDEIVRHTGLPVAMVSTILLDLEIAGRLERSAGQLVALRP